MELLPTNTVITREQPTLPWFLHSERPSSITVVDELAPSTPRKEKDPEHPASDVTEPTLSRSRKWAITIVASLFTLLVSAASTSYTTGFDSMMHDLGCSRPQAVLGLTTYVVAFGVFPLFTSAFSEEFGRQPLYLCSWAVFLMMHIAVALSPNYQVIALVRFIQGAAGSAGATMVAGTISDIWTPQERGVPMSIYSSLALAGMGFGTVVGGWVEMNPHLQWRWIQWIFLIVGAVVAAAFSSIVRETRATFIAKKRAKAASSKQPERYGKPNSSAKNLNLKQLIWVSATRPLVLFISEPIIFFISLYIGFAWGVFYCIIASVPAVFRELHGFNIGQIGTVNVVIIIAVSIGYITNLWQERLYQRSVSRRFVEARLYMCCVAGIVLPGSMFMFAWFCRSDIHWMALTISLTLYMWAVFTIYLAVFSYLADCYDSFASSALAGQSLVRNVIGGVFPLFTTRLFESLGYSWANTMFAFIGAAMIPIPFVLFFFGPKIRARSARCVQDGVRSPRVPRGSR
ncbi:multidrug transporter [Coprinopsis sp. MPI-PUGE-AT-0042]|nr:multidrug transporter [Coprinopsis sp. MPI-PUGE-AT-0042]